MDKRQSDDNVMKLNSQGVDQKNGTILEANLTPDEVSPNEMSKNKRAKLVTGVVFIIISVALIITGVIFAINAYNTRFGDNSYENNKAMAIYYEGLRKQCLDQKQNCLNHANEGGWLASNYRNLADHCQEMANEAERKRDSYLKRNSEIVVKSIVYLVASTVFIVLGIVFLVKGIKKTVKASRKVSLNM